MGIRAHIELEPILELEPPSNLEKRIRARALIPVNTVCKNGTPNFKGSEATLKLKSHYGSKIHGNPFEQRDELILHNNTSCMLPPNQKVV